MMLSSEYHDKKQSDENKDESEEDDQNQEVLISGDDRRRRVDVFKPEKDDIYSCIGQLDVEYNYWQQHKFRKTQMGTATVISVVSSNTENEEKEEKTKAIILTCAHNVRLTVLQCDKCDNYRLRRDKNGDKTECNCKHPTSKEITIKATKITFRDRSIQHNNYGETVENYDCKEHYVPDNEYETCPVPKSGFDWAFLQFTDNNTYAERLKKIHIQLVIGSDEFNVKKQREYAIFGYPHIDNNQHALLGMFSDSINQFEIKHNVKTKMQYLQQTAFDTGSGQSGSLIWFKENNIVKICGIHCGGSQGTKSCPTAHNVATLIDENIIDEFNYSVAILNGWKASFLNKSCIITKEQELKLFKKMLWKQFNESTDITLELLYGSKEQNHNKDASAFHLACDGKGSTITIIQSEYKHIFGGYTSIPWSSPKNVKWEFDPVAFLYLLRSQFNQGKIYQIDKNKGKKSVAHNKLNGPCFGRRDVIIKGSESFCFSNDSYNISGNQLCGGNSIIQTQNETKFAFKYECYEVYLLKNN
eukprot:450983_1